LLIVSSSKLIETINWQPVTTFCFWNKALTVGYQLLLSGDAEFYKYENHLDLCNLNSRINRLQWDCDRENHLGDLSPYHNKPTIKELLDNAYNIENYNILDRTNEDVLSNESDNAMDE
jgi:hypothetical protein